VQFVERPGAPAAVAFTVEQMMLIGFLLDRYRENTMAIDDATNTAIAEGALAVLGGLLQAAEAPNAPAPAPAPAPASSADAANERAAGARGRSNARGRGQGHRTEARAGGAANDASSAPSSPAVEPSGGDDIPSSPAVEPSEGDSIPSSPAAPTG